jgi:hypothetical protein
VRPIDPGNLNDLIRDCAIDLWQQGVTDAAGFVTAFNARYRSGLSEDQKLYCVDKWVAVAGKKMMHTVGKELKRIKESFQYDLPMDLQKYDIPDTLTMRKRWVPIHDAEEADLDEYLAALQENADDCLSKILGFTHFVERVRPVLRANPGWKTGDAIRWLKSQERRAA